MLRKNRNPRRDSSVSKYDTMSLSAWVLLKMAFTYYEKYQVDILST